MGAAELVGQAAKARAFPRRQRSAQTPCALRTAQRGQPGQRALRTARRRRTHMLDSSTVSQMRWLHSSSIAPSTICSTPMLVAW